MISSKTSAGINGIVKIPGDKSISHRSIIIPSIANGICEITNILNSDDVIKTKTAFLEMGVKMEEINNKLIIYGKGLNSLNKPTKPIYLGNSGTSARLLTGLLSSQNFDSKITGDKSLTSRPMGRIADPLKLMNAKIETFKGKLPISIYGGNLNNARVKIDIPSAQIKSGVLLAAINTAGKSEIIENNITRNHTEIMLEEFGAEISIKKLSEKKQIISINGKKELKSKNITVPSDLSSSAFFIVAALINENSNININNVNINPTRSGILTALKKMGAKINLINKRKINNEDIADLNVQYSQLNGCELNSDMAKLMIDEYPILSVAAAFANSSSIFRGLNELKVKESDRLELIRSNLLNCGCTCDVKDNDLYIDPISKNVKNVMPRITTNFDHRIAMSFAVFGSKYGKVQIEEADCINTSFPSFKNEFNKAGGKLY